MDKHTKANQCSSLGYERPAVEVQPLIAEGVLCNSNRLDILDWTENPDAL